VLISSRETATGPERTRRERIDRENKTQREEEELELPTMTAKVT